MPLTKQSMAAAFTISEIVSQTITKVDKIDSKKLDAAQKQRIIDSSVITKLNESKGAKK